MFDKKKVKKALRDFWYGKPHGERRLGDILEDKTGLYKHITCGGVNNNGDYLREIWWSH